MQGFSRSACAPEPFDQIYNEIQITCTEGYVKKLNHTITQKNQLNKQNLPIYIEKVFNDFLGRKNSEHSET